MTLVSNNNQGGVKAPHNNKENTMPTIYKSVKYITTNRTTYKLLKHKDNTVDVWAMREECKNQNSWTHKDYDYQQSYKNITIAKDSIYKLDKGYNA